MRSEDAFSGLHPAVNFIFFALVLVCSMCLMHPVCLLVSLACSVCYAIRLRGGRALRLSIRWFLPMMLLAAILNPAFNHQGVTILTYLPSGNPLTLESLLYGLAAAVMLVSVMEWFVCYSAVMTTDKFVYLFGRVIPAVSLVLSMALRFVPQFAEHLREVRQAQRCIGRDPLDGGLIRRVKKGVTVLSALVTWSLENAIETADSMRSRGYGLPGRSAFGIYRFDERDRTALLWLLACGGYLIAGWCAGGFRFSYYPSLTAGAVTPLSVTFPLAYLALCLTPLIFDRKEERTWKRLNSGI